MDANAYRTALDALKGLSRPSFDTLVQTSAALGTLHSFVEEAASVLPRKLNSADHREYSELITESGWVPMLVEFATTTLLHLQQQSFMQMAEASCRAAITILQSFEELVKRITSMPSERKALKQHLNATAGVTSTLNACVLMHSSQSSSRSSSSSSSNGRGSSSNSRSLCSSSSNSHGSSSKRPQGMKAGFFGPSSSSSNSLHRAAQPAPPQQQQQQSSNIEYGFAFACVLIWVWQALTVNIAHGDNQAKPVFADTDKRNSILPAVKLLLVLLQAQEPQRLQHQQSSTASSSSSSSAAAALPWQQLQVALAAAVNLACALPGSGNELRGDPAMQQIMAAPEMQQLMLTLTACFAGALFVFFVSRPAFFVSRPAFFVSRPALLAHSFSSRKARPKCHLLTQCGR
jgi:hypothetical protein